MSQASVSLVDPTIAHDRGVWFYRGMAIVMVCTVCVGFGPSLVNSANRQGPLSGLVVVHAILSLAWLAVFFTQATLIAHGNIALHRRVGTLAALLALAIIGTGYFTCVAMAQRGYDLSGDLNARADPLYQLVFPLNNLLVFAILLGLGYWNRRRPETHKRFMLLATVAGMMPAPLAHLIGHSPTLRAFGPIIVLFLFAFLFAGAVHDRLTLKRIHPVSLWGATAIFIYYNLLAVVIGPSAVWHRLAGALLR